MIVCGLSADALIPAWFTQAYFWRQGHVFEGQAFRRHDARHRRGRRRVDAKGLFDDGVEVRQSGQVRDGVAGLESLELFAELALHGGVTDQEPEDVGQGDGGTFGSGDAASAR